MGGGSQLLALVFSSLFSAAREPKVSVLSFPLSTEHLFSGDRVRGERKWHSNTLAEVVHSTVHVAAGCF